MANFAIAADENVIARGNKLIEELQEPGEKKGVTLNRLFDLVSTHLQEDQLKRSGVDTEALDASITNIRNLFTAALSGKEEIRAEYERRIAELRESNEESEKNYKIQLGKLASEKEDALRKYTDLKELQETAETARKAAEEQAASAVNLVKEKEKTNIMLTEKLRDAEQKAGNYDTLEKENASVEFIENEEDLNYETLLHLHQKYQPTQVMIEYNGMWDNTKFVDEICIDQWQVVQILTTISAETFDLYYNNMRGQFVYHVTGSDLVIVNRCDENTKKYPIRGSIKSLNPMCQIVYENKNRQIEDLTVNDLPYNLNDDYIEVNDMDYGIFCMHIMENPQIYENKTIKIKGKVIGRDKLIENGFVLGRQAMVCCSDDMQLLGLVCISKYAKDLIKDEWLVVDGTISLEYDESIQSNIPILHVDHLEGAKPLENEYVTFD